MKTLIWKEWREQRLFFFLAVGIIILSRVVPVFLPKEMIHYDEYAGVLSHFILPIIFALFLGAISFTNEFARNTKSFLSSQPVTSARIFWTKFLFGLILLLFFVLLAHLAFGVPFGNPFHVGREVERWPIFYLLISLIMLYSATCLSSLLLKNTLPAIICTPFILIFNVFLLLPFSVVLFLTSPFVYVFAFLTIFALIALFPVLSFLVWQKAIVKDVSPARIVITVTALILFVSFGLHAVANLRAGLELNKAIRQAKAEGIKLTPREVIPPSVPDKENAALVYKQVFDLVERLKTKYETKEDFGPGSRSWGNLKFSPNGKNLFSKIAKSPEFTDLYALIEKAVNLPSCRFDIKYDAKSHFSRISSTHFTELHNLARLLKARTDVLAQEGRYKEALESVKTNLRLGHSLGKEPFYDFMDYRIQFDSDAAKFCLQLLNDSKAVFTTKDCQDLISEIGKEDNWKEQRTEALEGELALSYLYVFKLGLGKIQDFLSYGDFGTNKEPFWRFITSMGFSAEEKQISADNIIFWMIYGSYFGQPILKGDYAFFIREYSNLIELSRKPYYLVKNDAIGTDRRMEGYRRKGVEPKFPLSMSMFPYNSYYVWEVPIFIKNDFFKLALALRIYKREHGYYPDKLAPLSPEVIPELPLDPFTGNDYRYRKEGRGFIVYSVGLNGKDDNGIYDSKQKYDDIAWKVLN